MPTRSYPDRQALIEERRLFGRHAWLLQPAYWAVRVYRFGNAGLGDRSIGGVLRHGFYFGAYSVVRLLTGIDLPRTVSVGPRLMIHHFGGVIVHPQTVIGSDCVLRHGVTLGQRRETGGVPTIGDRVVFGAYAQVLGEISVGDGATIGALSLVLRDVESGVSVAGVPAVPLRVR